jgi:hypothetical protein
MTNEELLKLMQEVRAKRLERVQPTQEMIDQIIQKAEQAVAAEMETNCVEIPAESIRWYIQPLVREASDGVLVELQWGWTAGMSEADLERLAEDSPRGYDSVTTTLRFAEELRDKLTEIIEQHKVRDAELRAESDKRFREKFPDFDEKLEKWASNQK